MVYVRAMRSFTAFTHLQVTSGASITMAVASTCALTRTTAQWSAGATMATSSTPTANSVTVNLYTAVLYTCVSNLRT